MKTLLNKKTAAALALCLSMSVSTFGQSQVIHLTQNKATVSSIIKAIKKQTQMSVDFSQNTINLNKTVSLKSKTMTLGELMNQILAGDNNLTYKIVDRHIVVVKSFSNTQQSQKVQNRGGKHKLTGVVLDQNGEPIIGASVLEKGTKNGTVTDIDGNFELSVSAETPVIEVSYIGFDVQTLKMNSGKATTIRMRENSHNLNEVVVVGYGTQKKVNLTGSVSSISSDKLTNRVETNVLSAIQGTVPGVTIISRPGSTPSINFRGRGNLGASEPLYVIDGVIADATFFQNLDPESIESISFLKDAASSAIYGSRAAYGVVLVTTKQGKKERMSVSYSGMVGVKTPTYLPDLISSSEYAKLLNEAMYNRNPAGGKNQAYTAEQIGWFKDGSKPDYYPNTDWIDQTMDKHVATTQHSLNVSGGSEKVQYYLGGGYQYNDSFVRGRNSNRYNLNMSVTSNINKWLAVNGSAKFIRNENSTDNGVPSFTNYLLVPSIMVAQQSNGEFGSMAGGQQATLTFIQNNPLRQLAKKDWSKSAYENSLYTLGMDITPLKGLKISASGSYKRYEYKYKSYSAKQDAVNHFETGNPISGTASDINKMSMSWSSSSRLQTTLVATYNFNIGQDHSFIILGGTSYEDNKYESLSGSRKNFATDSSLSMGAGSSAPEDITNGASMSDYKLLSYFGRINYSFKDRYLFEANVRTDGSSRFYKSERWGWFPSFSAGWRVSEESFMKPITWVNNFKIRASYGTLGNINNVGNYDYFQLYDKSGNYVFDKKPVEGIAESKPANRTLTWEKVAIADVGIDLDLFNNHLSIVADYYVKNTSNILLAYNVPVETGITVSPSQNVGKVKNTGFEMAVTYRNKIGDFRYDVTGNIAINHNKIVNLSGSDNMIQNGGDKIRYILKEGESIGSFYGYKTAGLYTQKEIDEGHYYTLGRKPNAGDIKYVPQRDNVEWGTAITDDDRTIIGCDVPKFTYGLNLNLGYKDFELSLFGQGIAGAKVAFESEQVWAFFLNSNPRRFHLGRWTEENPNPNANYPRIYGGVSQDTYNQNFSDRQLFSANYFRIKTITLGYRLPRVWMNRIGLASAKVFVTGENLFTFRGDNVMKDFDPESVSGRSVSALGEKSIAFGLNVEFKKKSKVMKTKYIKHLAVLGMLTLSVSSCDLDVVPPESISADSYWKTEQDAWYAMNEIYANGMPDFIDGICDEMYTDNAHSHKPWEGPFEAFQQGGVTAGDGAGNYSYTTIRLVNNYIANVDRCAISNELKERTKSEARFFRAWSYYNMVIKFGGVPLVTDVMEYNAPNVARDDAHKVKDFVLSELADIAKILPESYPGGSKLNETGRVTCYAALALRTRAALAFGDYTEAEKSAKEIIDSNKFSLYRVTELTDAQKLEAAEMTQFIDFASLGIDKDKFVKGIFSYEGVWQNDNGNVSDPEVILAHEHTEGANSVDWARYQYARPSQLVKGYSSYEPLAELVEAYWNIDGKTIPTKIAVDQNKQNYENLYAKVEGIDQKAYIAKVPTLNLKNDAYMQQFRNRDSRLYASILFPFKGWHETDFGTFYYRWNPAWAGKDGNESWTGFSFRKLVSVRPFDTGWGENYSYDDFPVLRYAEILISAAEAHIMNSGYDAIAMGWLNELRDRCGMPNVPASFVSKEEALEFVRNERRIELAGEGQRFADMRRYGNEYCAKMMTGTSYGINKYVVVDKKWESKNMLFPIPTSARDLNPLLEQNPGY